MTEPAHRIAAVSSRTVLAVALAAALACAGDSSGPDPDSMTGRVRITAETSGLDPDPDGYRITVGPRTGTVEANGSIVFDELPAGSHPVDVSGVADNCRVADTLPSTVDVAADTETDILIAVECGAFARVTCPDLSLASASGAPIDRVAVSGLPPELERPVAASVTLDGTSHEGFAWIIESDDGPELVVPIHPEHPFDGGTVSLVVSDGTRACPSLEFTIESLPPAAGELDAVVDLLQAMLDDQAGALGATRDSLVATPLDELPPQLWPLALAQTVLDDPANDATLRDAARGDLGAEVEDWLDRLLARTGLRSALATDAGAVTAPGAAPGSLARDVSALQCTPLGVGSSDAGVLEECMADAAEARRRADGVSKQVSEDISLALSAIGDFAGEYGIPLVDVVDAMFTAVFWVVYNAREETAAVYPSRFLEMELEVDRPTFAEDEEAEGAITLATVTAGSEGWDLQEVLVEAFTNGLSAAASAGNFDVPTGSSVNEAIGRLGGMIEEKLAGKSADELAIPPEEFGPVDVNDPDWIQARVIGESIERVPPLGYRPYLHGTATFSVRTYDGKFGGQQIQRDVEIEIPPIQILITPRDTIVEAADPEAPDFTTFDVRVLDAKWPDSVDLDLSEHPRQGAAEITLGDGNEHEVDYLAPSQPDFDEPDLIVVRHTGSSGALANGPERQATATVRFGQITITPRDECVDPGDDIQFEVEVEGLGDEAVTWTADVGTIDETSGAWTAPEDAAAGTVATITATSASEPSVSDEVEVRIGQCDICSGTIALSGGIGGAGTGPTKFELDGAELQIGYDGAFVDPVVGNPISGGFIITGFAGEPGTWAIDQASVGRLDTSESAWYWPAGDPENLDCGGCGGSLTIHEASETVLRGELSVTMPTAPYEDEPPTTATLTFEAWLYVDGSPGEPYSECVITWEGQGAP